MLSRCLSFICGVALLLVAVWGGFTYLKGWLLSNETLHIFNRIKVSSTAYAMMHIVVPPVALLASLWLRLAFERDDVPQG